MLALLSLLVSSPALAQEPPKPARESSEPAREPSDSAPPDVPIEDLPIVDGPRIVEYVEADYPPEAEAQQLEATVLLLVELDDTGAVTAVEVLEPVGHGFDEAAVDAVERMRFSPAMTEAGPVGVAFEFAYGFTFEPEPPPEDEPPPPAPVNLDGRLTEMGTRAPIRGATVVVDGTDLTATTDADGRFEIRGVPLGFHTIRVLSPDHVSLERNVEIVEGQVTEVDLWLRATAYRDNEIVAVYEREREEVTRRTLSIEEVRRVPGTFGDPIKVVQSLPGAARSPFGTGLLIIRGSNPEDSGVYVDGVRIPIIYHLTGTTSVLSPDLIEAVDYLPGGYGVQYGRTMGGVIDVRTKSEFEEDGKIVWGTDVLDSQLYYEGRLGKNKKHGLAVGARRSYIDAFIPLFTGGSDFTLKPRYWDYSVKWVPELGAGEASAFVYGFNDLLAVGTPADVAQGPDQDTQGALRTEYSSHRAVLRYSADLSDTWRLDVTPSFGVDYTFTDVGDEFALDNVNWIGELRVEAPWTPHETVEIVPGLDVIGGWWRFAFASPLSLSDADDPLAERNPLALDGRGTGWGPDAYLKANLRPFAKDPERLLITPGVRANLVHFTYDGAITGDGVAPWTRGSLDPRLATRARLFDGGFVKGATGLYHQPPQPHESVGLGTENRLGYEKAWNSSLGFEHQLTQAVRWDVDLFYRHMDGLVVFSDAFTGLGDTAWINAGEGRAYGAELIVRHAPAGRFFGWLSYTLSRSERRDAPDDDWYAFDFDQRHILSAQGGYDLPRDFGISAQVQFVTGNPSSHYDTGVYDADTDAYSGFRISPYNGERLPPFFQTSLRFDRLWTFRTWQLETYVDLINTVRGVNPEFTQYAYDYSEYAYIRGLPFIPNIGIEAKFFP